uniref:Elongation of very long chain fatty acids protein n=1 Tax=Strigamia maritima TaxID=126957 RepID=T1INH9_STRMM
MYTIIDVRMDDYYTMNSPFFVLMLCGMYIILSLYIGPWMMKNRKPFNLKSIIITYNISMVVANAYLLIQAYRHGWSKYKWWICEPVDTSNRPEALLIAKLFYYYYVTKYLDWFDTMFFVLRKKFMHITVLHLYHHCIMPINTWIVIRYLPGGHSILGGIVNTLVHVIMYTYYTFAALGPEWQKYLWWKKYITVLQMIAKLFYYYYVTKYLDWFDTIFFILRKKFTHITVLHLYHHGIMPINVWMFARFVPGGDIILGEIINTLVHVIMYTYYIFAALGPEWQKYLWWKKYITVLQMVQFVVGVIQGLLLLYYQCEFPKTILYFCYPQGFIFLALFANFYVKSYTKRGHVLFGGSVNTFDHVVMYTYYTLAALGPQMQKYLWWKRYITLMQMMFMILRKKYTHISILHLHHHGIMPLNSWMIVRYLPGGHMLFGGFLNTFVHVVMYTYYTLAALGPQIKKYLWWKRYITVMQIDMWELRDRRLDDYATMNSPLCVLMVCCFYVLFSLYIGPWLMKNRKPYNIKPVIIAYNTIMVVANGLIFIQVWRYGWSEYKLICEPVDVSNSINGLMVVNITYAYYVTKYLDWFDTMFMILRKKHKQINILHLYHHSSMPLNSWMITRYCPGGHILFGGMVNTFVHVVMYTYYTLAALGPQMQKYLWWKRYITLMQMTQFIVGLIHMFLVLTCDFEFPKVIFYFIFPQGFLFLILFANFYAKTYTKKQPITHSESKTHAE